MTRRAKLTLNVIELRDQYLIITNAVIEKGLAYIERILIIVCEIENIYHYFNISSGSLVGERFAFHTEECEFDHGFRPAALRLFANVHLKFNYHLL